MVINAMLGDGFPRSPFNNPVAAELIRNCTAPDPAQRPTAQQVLMNNWVNSGAAAAAAAINGYRPVMEETIPWTYVNESANGNSVAGRMLRSRAL